MKKITQIDYLAAKEVIAAYEEDDRLTGYIIALGNDYAANVLASLITEKTDIETATISVHIQAYVSGVCDGCPKREECIALDLTKALVDVMGGEEGINNELENLKKLHEEWEESGGTDYNAFREEYISGGTLPESS